MPKMETKIKSKENSQQFYPLNTITLIQSNLLYSLYMINLINDKRCRPIYHIKL